MTLTLPVDRPTKAEAETMIHAIEELYFYHRYTEASKLAREVLERDLNEAYRKIVQKYLGRCEERRESRHGL
jgi:hypothetical protein